MELWRNERLWEWVPKKRVKVTVTLDPELYSYFRKMVRGPLSRFIDNAIENEIKRRVNP